MKKCCVCGTEFENYRPIEEKYIKNMLIAQRDSGHIVRSETLNIEEYECPHCYALDKDRLVVLFLKELFDKLLAYKDKFTRLKILDIAPSAPVGRWVKTNIGFSEYFTADLFMENVDYNIDIQNMEIFAPETFDIIICCHVFEHVRDDRKAMSEIFRVLKKDGVAVLLVPLDLNWPAIDEAYDLSPEEEIRRFGQEDHVRRYSKEGFIKRLENAGFFVAQYKKNILRRREWRENALTGTSTLYVGTKNGGDIKKLFWHGREVTPYTGIGDLLEGKRLLVEGYNYYIDSVKYENGVLSIWGWFYFYGLDSRYSKYKLIIKGGETVDIREFDWRDRQDIEDQFNDRQDGRLLNSGIDIQLDITEDSLGEYDLELMFSNNDKYASISLGVISRED